MPPTHSEDSLSEGSSYSVSNSIPNPGPILDFRPSSIRVQQLSPAALAYLGDAVYELHIRNHFLTPPKRIQIYHQQVVAQVRAEKQADHLRSLLPHLNSSELEIVRWGRNAVNVKPRRLDPDTYQQATSLETLIGYLYLTDPDRLGWLLAQLCLQP